MGNLLTETLGKVLTEGVGNLLTELLGKVLDIYKFPKGMYSNPYIRCTSGLLAGLSVYSG